MPNFYEYIDLNNQELRNWIAQNLATRPAGIEGRLILNTQTNAFEGYVGGQWVSLSVRLLTELSSGAAADGTVATSDGAGGIAWETPPDGVTDHGLLSGLGDDDHTHYALADGSRGNFEPTGSASAAVSAHESDLDPHPQYLTQTEGDTRYVNETDFTKAAVDALNVDADTVDGSHAADLLARANHTGTQTASTISNFDTQVRTSRLDQMAAPTVALPLNGQKITGLAEGTSSTDAATVGQVTAAVDAKSWKDPVRAATTANITLSGTQTIDGVAVVAGDRVLVKNQTTASQNGIYVVAAGAWTRSTDANTATEVAHSTALVTEGNTNQGDVYTAGAVATLDTSSVTYVKTGEGNTTYTADGTTLTLTGSQFAVATGGISATQLATSVAGNGLTGGGGSALAVGQGTGITVGADAISVDAEWVTDLIGAMVTGNTETGITVTYQDADNTIDFAVNYGAAVALDGTTANGAANTAARSDHKHALPTNVPRKFSASVGDGTATSIAVTHNLGTRDVTVQVYDSTTYETVFCGVVRTSTTQVTLNFGSAPAANAFRVVVTG